jgi:hypothetical protein
MVPVNLRDPKSWKELGNKFGLVPLLLPVGIENPIARVFEVQRRMNDLKASYQAVLAMGILGLVGLAPRMLQKQALDFLAKKGTAVMTNVPGPQQPLYMAGAMIRRMMFWVPQSGDIGVGVSILSYAGGVQFGLITDKKLCPEPQRIIDRFAPEFEKLVLALCMLPWDRPVDADAAQHWLFTPIPGPAAATGRPATKRRRRASTRVRRAPPAVKAGGDPTATPPATDGSTPAGAQPPDAEPAQAGPAAAPDGNGAGTAEPATADGAAAAAARPPGVRARRSAFAAARAAERVE